MIVEFFGLPASGKTTNMKSFLEKNNSSVSLMDYCYNNKKAITFFSIFTKEFISYYILVISLFIKKKHKTSRDFTILYYFACIYLRYMRCRKEKKYDFYLNDHGIIQNIASVLWNEENLIEQCGKIILHIEKYFKDEIIYIYTANSDNSNIFSRITRRGFKIRLYSLTFEEAEKVLNVQRKFFDYASENRKIGLTCIKVSTLLSEKESSDIINDYIINSLQ